MKHSTRHQVGFRIPKVSNRMGAVACASLLAAGLTVFGAPVLNSSFSVSHILPAAMQSTTGIGGMDLLPNGDGAICIWGGSQKSNGEVWIVEKLATGTPGTATRIATGLREPLGLKVIGNDFYVLEKGKISKYTGSGTTWTRTDFFKLPTAWYNDAQWHHFSLHLLERDNALWFTTGMAYEPDNNDPVERGALIKVPLDGSGFVQMARGMRNTDGLALGPDNEFFITDNQGHWKPVNVMYHVPTKNIPAKGRFYGYRTNTNNACKLVPPNADGTSCPEDPEYPPAIWMPYGQFSSSPTRPVLLKSGPYAGQMISGDVYVGGILRYFVEKVNDEYQGAVFSFMAPGSAGITFGINQMMYTPTGSILVAAIGGGTCNLGGSNNWSFNATCRGLDLLTHTDKVPFDIKAVRSTPKGFEIEFTSPANAEAGKLANYAVKTTVFTPVFDYGKDGGANDNNITVAVTAASLSSDGLRANIELASLLTKRMYAITLSNVKGPAGENPATNVAYYTLNSVSKVTPVAAKSILAEAKRPMVDARSGRVQVRNDGDYRFEIKDIQGRSIRTFQGKGVGEIKLGQLPQGLLVLTGEFDGASVSQKWINP